VDDIIEVLRESKISGKVVTDMAMSNLIGEKFAVELMKIRPDISVVLCIGPSKKISDEVVLKPSLRTLFSGVGAWVFNP